MATAATPCVRLYWRPGCIFCLRLRRRLRRLGIPAEEINIWEDPSAAAFVRSVAAGNETVPTVAVHERVLVNPSIEAVVEALERRDSDRGPQAWRGGGRVLVKGSKTTGPRRASATRLALVATAVAASLAAGGTGHVTLSWAIDAVAIAAVLVLRLRAG